MPALTEKSTAPRLGVYTPPMGIEDRDGRAPAGDQSDADGRAIETPHRPSRAITRIESAGLSQGDALEGIADGPRAPSFQSSATIQSRETLPASAADPSSAGLLPIDLDNSSLILPGKRTASVPKESRPPSRARKSASFERRYGHRKTLGEGGMGEVHLYTDRTIGRDIALKVIRGERKESAEARFVREARVQGQLEHPSVVPVYDLGSDAEGKLFFTMKRIRGQSLEEILKGLRKDDPDFVHYSRRRLLGAFLQVCQTMAYAHTRGVLHRDLKPANLMLGAFGEVYVLDWGLAKLVGATEEDADTITEHTHLDGPAVSYTVDGDILGTPGYMAPEQLAGSVDDLDERADIYALGAILHELLTLKPLHRGDTINDILISTLGAPKAPSAVAPAREIAPELDELCLAALAKAPEERLATASELAARLEAYLDGDRDMALRRAAAATHTESAIAALDEAPSDGDEIDPADHESKRRGKAMREISAALAMDPSNEQALTTFYRLMTEVPDTLPREVDEELERSRLEAKRVGLRAAAWVYLSFAAFVPFVIYMGVKSWVAFTAQGIAITACFLTTVWHLFRDRDAVIPLDHLFVATASVIVSTVIFGPFILVPCLALANTSSYAIATHRRDRRIWIVVMGTLAVVTPVFLELMGWLPQTFHIEDGNLVIRSMMLDFTPSTAVFFLLILHVPLVFGVGWYIATMKGAYNRLERQMRMQAWQLAQIVPAHLRPESSEDGEGSP